MELVSEGPVNRDGLLRAVEGSVLQGLACHCVMSAALALPSHQRDTFPLLVRVCPFLGDDYDDESLWLTPLEVPLLVKEFDRFVDVCFRHEFLPGLDGAQVLQYWQRNWEAEEFEDHRRSVRELLGKAVQLGCWINFLT